MSNLSDAGRNGGWVLAAGVAICAFVFAAFGINPVKEADDHVFSPAAESIGLSEGKCPNGWEHNAIEDGHENAITCSKDSYVVTMYPPGQVGADGKSLDNKGNYGLNTLGGTNAVQIPCLEVPDWPDDWCA